MDLEIQGFQSYYFLTQKKHTFYKKSSCFARCLKRSSPLISFPLPGSVKRELVEFE